MNKEAALAALKAIRAEIGKAEAQRIESRKKKPAPQAAPPKEE